MSFWHHMKLWEQMLLVLAVGMLLTLLAGICKLTYNKLRVRKHTKIAEARKSHMEAVNGGPVLSMTDEVPFGIKALEAGVEVEGIYISRPNTPGRYSQSQATLVASDVESLKSRGQGPPSPRFPHGNGSGNSFPVPSVKSGHPMIYQPSPYIQLPPASYAGISSVRSSASSLNTTPPITRSSSAGEAAQIHRRHSEIAMGQEWQQAGKSASILPDADTLAKLEGRLPHPGYDYQKSGKQCSSRTPSPHESQISPSLPSVDENEISEESSRESDSSLEHHQHPRYFSTGGLLATYSSPSLPSVTQAHQLSGSTQGDLSLLHTHRLSHAAEVGQLLPRKRQSTNHSGSPTSESEPQPFYSQATSDPVYALDIAIPKGGLEGLHYPPQLFTKDIPFDGDRIWLSRPGSGVKSACESGSSEIIKEEILRLSSGSESGPLEWKSTKFKEKKVPKKKGGPRNSAPACMGLEVQNKEGGESKR